MNIDFIRGATTIVGAIVIVMVIVVGLLYMTIAGIIEPALGVTSIIGIGGPAAAFLWQAESNKQAAKQAERNIMQQAPGPGGTVVTGDNPTVNTPPAA